MGAYLWAVNNSFCTNTILKATLFLTLTCFGFFLVICTSYQLIDEIENILCPKKDAYKFDCSSLFFFCAYSSAVIHIEGFIVKLLLPLCKSWNQKYLVLPRHCKISRCILWPLCCSLHFQFLLELSLSHELAAPLMRKPEIAGHHIFLALGNPDVLLKSDLSILLYCCPVWILMQSPSWLFLLSYKLVTPWFTF